MPKRKAVMNKLFCRALTGIFSVMLCASVLAAEPARQPDAGKTDPRAIIAYDPQDGVPQPTEGWGPATGNWRARKGRNGYVIMGGAGFGLVNALRAGATVATTIVTTTAR